MHGSPEAAAAPRPGVAAAKIALAVWALTLLIILARAYLQPQRNTVYPIFANAAREWVEGVDVYDRTLPRPDLDKFRYAPIVAAAFAPLAVFPDADGGVWWRVVNMAVFLGGFVAFARTVFPGQARLTPATVALLGWALLPLSVGSLNNAQPNALVAGCLLLAAAAIVRNRWTVAALCLAVPVLFKVYPLAVVLLFFLRHPLRLGWRTGLAVVAGCLLPFLLHDPSYVAQLYQSWIEQVAGDNRRDFPLEYSYRDFHTMVRMAGWSMPELPYALLQLAMAGLVAGVVLRGQWLLRWTLRQQLRAAFDLGCCWIIVFGPATENCTYTLLAPTLALASWEVLQAGQPGWKRLWILGIVALFVANALLMATPVGRHVSFAVMPLGGLLVFAERLLSCVRPLRRLVLQPVQAQPLTRAALLRAGGQGNPGACRPEWTRR